MLGIEAVLIADITPQELRTLLCIWACARGIACICKPVPAHDVKIHHIPLAVPTLLIPRHLFSGSFQYILCKSCTPG